MGPAPNKTFSNAKKGTGYFPDSGTGTTAMSKIELSIIRAEATAAIGKNDMLSLPVFPNLVSALLFSGIKHSDNNRVISVAILLGSITKGSMQAAINA